jgi:hypothetical protein
MSGLTFTEDAARQLARVYLTPDVVAQRSETIKQLVGWVEPLRNPSHVAIVMMGFASTFARRASADKSVNPSYEL